MASQRRSEIYVGISVFVALLLLIIAILWGKGVKIAGESRILTIKFERVGGLAPGDAANVSGVQVGRVTSVQIVGDSVQVKAKVGGKVDFNSDATATISNAELMGGKLVDISPGKSAQPLGENEVIPGTYAPGIGEIASTFGDQAINIQSIMQNIKTITSRLKLFFQGDSESQTIQSTLQHISATSQRIDSLMFNNADALQKSITNLEHSTTILREFLSDEKDRARRLISSTEELAINLKTLSDSTQQIVNSVNSSGSSVGRMLKSDSLYNQVQRSLNSFDSLMIDLRNHPEKYLDKVKFKVGLF